MVNYTYDERGRLTREDNKALDRTMRYAYDGARLVRTYCEMGTRLVRTYCEMGTRLAEVPDFGYDAQSNSFVDTDYERRVCFGCVRKVRNLAPLAACCPSELAFRLLDGLSTILWKRKVGEEWEEHEYIVRRNILGDVTQLYDTLGNLCVQYRYDAWGQVYPITIFDYHGIARVNPILYRGYVYDKETELYYLNSRYYDPETGRFLNADSLEYLEPESVYGINLYAYCGGDPVNNVDPMGNKWWDWLISGLQIVVGGLLVATGVGAGFGAMLVVGGVMGMASNALGSQIGGGIGSMLNGGGAISTGISLLSFGIPGIIAGIGLMAIGGATMIMGANEVVSGITGTNYMRDWMGGGLYDDLYLGLNIASSVGIVAGRLGMRTVGTKTIGNHDKLSRSGQKPYARITRGVTVTNFNGRGIATWSRHNALHGGRIGNPHWHIEGLDYHSSELGFLEMLLRLIFGGR